MPKFTIEKHEKDIRELLNKKPQVGQRPGVLQSLLDRAKARRIRPSGGG